MSPDVMMVAAMSMNSLWKSTALTQMANMTLLIAQFMKLNMKLALIMTSECL